MTDHTDDDFFDDAKSEFTGRDDTKDRLVAIFATGPLGKRKNEEGEFYPYVGTVTVVLDDGPDGTSVTSLVPAINGKPYPIHGLQWSAVGLYSRLAPRVGTDLELKPVVGRINEKQNRKKGRSNPWGIAEPTDEDKELVRRYRVQLIKIRDEIVAAREKADDLEPSF